MCHSGASTSSSRASRLLLLPAAVAAAAAAPSAAPLRFVVDNAGAPLAAVDAAFLSWTLDAGALCEPQPATLGFFSPLVQRRLAALRPFFLRVGGTLADRQQLAGAGVTPQPEPPGMAIVSCDFSQATWDALAGVAEGAGADLIVGFDGLLRDEPGGAWNPRNAALLLAQAARRHPPLWGAEVGNEPDLWSGVCASCNISAEVHAADFSALRAAAAAAFAGSGVAPPLVLGPDVTCIGAGQGCGALNDGAYLAALLAAAPDVDVVTWHLYSFLNYSEIFSRAAFDAMAADIGVVAAALHASPLAGHPLWVGEGGPHWRLPQPLASNLSAEFAYASMLGALGRAGVRVLARQTVYTLLHADGGGAPAFWFALLFKRLMGAEVLDVYATNATATSDVRVFAHRGGAGCGAPPCVTALVLNAGDTPVSVEIELLGGGGPPCSGAGTPPRAEFAFTPGDDTPAGEATAEVNGVALQFAPGSSDLPPIAPVARRCDDPVVVANRSLTFLVLN